MTKDKTIDRRIARTKFAIQDALVTLIKEKGFDSITVSDIVARANINRGTFYLHYQDKFDLLEKTEAEILKEIQQIFLQANSLPTTDLNKAEQLQRLIIMLLEYVKEHANLMQAFFGLQGNYSFITRVRSIAEQNLKLGSLSGLNEKNFLVPREYLLSYVLHANLGVLQAWFVTGCKEAPQEIAQILFQLSFAGPMRAAGLDINKV